MTRRPINISPPIQPIYRYNYFVSFMDLRKKLIMNTEAFTDKEIESFEQVRMITERIENRLNMDITIVNYKLLGKTVIGHKQ